MSRDDSLLYSGIGGSTRTSVSAENRAKAKEQKLQEKQDKRIKLAPAAEIVVAEIQKEIDALRTIDYLNIEDMLNDEHFKAEMMSRKKTIEKLNGVQSRLKNLLRERKETKHEARPE
jgi:hypothetical protein